MSSRRKAVGKAPEVVVLEDSDGESEEVEEEAEEEVAEKKEARVHKCAFDGCEKSFRWLS